MLAHIKFYWQKWQTLSSSQQRALGWRMVASALVILAGCGFIFGLRANTVGEDGASLAMYAMGALIVMFGHLVIFGSILRFPEQMALKIALVVVIFCSTWVNLEENVVLPLMASNCDADCIITYERHIPFVESALVYDDRDGWQVAD